jgi:hypothetical protein
MRPPWRKWAAGLLVIVVAAAAKLGLLLLPAALRRDRGQPGAAVTGEAATIEEAVAVCRSKGLAGWPLVAFAQQLVYRRFQYYSCRNLWNTPAGAFRAGRGYCTQYNLALAQVLEALGLDVRPVFSLRVRVADDPRWAMGHTWLHVRIDGEERDVCAGHAGNLPGRVNFTPQAPVWRGRTPVLLATHCGMILFCGFLEWRAMLTRRPLPQWMFQARTPPTDPGSAGA